MVSDSIDGASSPSSPGCRDFSRKKRRSAKLKQCKLDARREQWLAHGVMKSKGCREESNGDPKQSCGDRNRQLQNLETRRRGEENGGGSIQQESDSESPSNSPTGSLLGGTDSGSNFTNSSSSSSSSGGSCSGSITEEEEGGDDDGCLDDWEAVADALAADDKREAEKSENSTTRMSSEHEPIAQLNSSGGSMTGVKSDGGNSKPECPVMVQRVVGNSRAWRSDDAFRPQSLPNLSKQRSFPAADRRFVQGGIPWPRSSSLSVPSPCPICCEELDHTDSSFLPCLCGFRLCLFCHKRILEEDGRCPGCRKPYEHDPVEAEPSIQGGSLTSRFARSYSMITRS